MDDGGEEDAPRLISMKMPNQHMRVHHAHITSTCCHSLGHSNGTRVSSEETVYVGAEHEHGHGRRIDRIIWCKLATDVPQDEELSHEHEHVHTMSAANLDVDSDSDTHINKNSIIDPKPRR